MRKISLLFVLFSFLFISNSFSQEWMRLWEDPTSNFYDVQREFYNYWDGKTPERGQGWMLFKRWEYAMEPRVYPTGNRPDPTIAFREMQMYRNRHKDRVNDLSDWVSLGPSSWLSISYNPGIGRINCITTHPTNPNILFAGSPSGGLWKSTNGGANWTTATDNLEVIGISGIVFSKRNPSVMYIATGDGDGAATYSIGVLKSTDFGDTWSTTGFSYQVSQGQRINKLIASPANSNTLFLAATGGLFYSMDAAASWTQVLTGNFRDIEFHPANSSIIYATVGTTFYKSTNGGLSFVQTGTGLPTSGVFRIALGVSPAGPNYVYALACNNTDNGFYGFYRSTDAGETFVETINSPNILGYSPTGSSTGGQGTYDLAIAVSPVNVNVVFTGGINIWKSTDAGNSFTCNTYWVYPPSTYGYVHADIHSLDFYGTTLYSGADGGLFKTTNFGDNWSDISEGMSTTQFYRFGGTPQDPDYLIGGTQDNGTNMYTGVWTHVLGADGMEAAVDPTNPDNVYCEIQNGGLRRSSDGGQSFSSMVGNITGTGGWITPFILDPQRPSTIYAGFQDIWKTEDQGSNWTKLSDIAGSTFRSMAISQFESRYIYAATLSTIYRTTDGGASWKDIKTGLPTNSITYVDVSDSDPLEIWVTLSGYTAGQKVYTSTNGGDNWTNISGTLPNLPANCIKYLNPDRLFIGMDVGAYYRDITMSDWEPFMNNLPNVEVSEFEIHLPTNKIRAATYGRGIWESVIPPMVGTASNGTNIPDKFALYQNYPNPFNPQTIIRFDIAAMSNVSLKIFNILGQEIRTLVNSELAPGVKSVTWDGKNNSGMAVNSGVYIYVLSAGDFRESKKLVLLK